MKYGNGLFITTIKHENVKAIDADQFDERIVDGSRELYWFIAIRNKSYKESFYISELLSCIQELKPIERILVVKIYGLDGNERAILSELCKEKHLTIRKIQIIYTKILKKLRPISM